METDKKLRYPPPPTPKTRPLVVRRDNWGQLALHDLETGEMIACQAELVARQAPGDITEVTVTFRSLPIEVNDG